MHLFIYLFIYLFFLLFNQSASWPPVGGDSHQSFVYYDDIQKPLLTSNKTYLHDGAEDKISMKCTTKQASFSVFCFKTSFLQPRLCFVNSLPPPHREYRKGTPYKKRRNCFFPILKVHKIEIFFGFDFEICIISLLVMSKYKDFTKFFF